MSEIKVRVNASPSDETKRATEPMKATNQILRFFDCEHLPPNLKVVGAPLRDVAHQMTESLPPSAELSAGLRKLLEAKDCFVRAALPVKDGA